jgi:hypothetical protein
MVVRSAVWLTIVPAILLVNEIRLSRGDHNYSRPEPPALWDNAQPKGRWTSEPVPQRLERGAALPHRANCIAIVSLDYKSQFTLTSIENGVDFDIDADGNLDRVAWTAPASDVGFLAIDRNEDGRITNGAELIGDRTVAGAPSVPNALMQLVGPPGTRASLDVETPVFSKLILWWDTNHNGVSETAEMRRAEQELASVGLGYEPHRRTDGYGNESRNRSFVHVRTGQGVNQPLSANEDLGRLRRYYEVCLASR